MKPLLPFLVLASVATLLMWLPLVWRYRNLVVYPALLLELTIVALFMTARPGLLAVVFVTISLYKLVNLARIVRGRMQADYLKQVTRTTAVRLSLLHISVIAVGALNSQGSQWPGEALYVLAGLQLAAAVVLLASTQRNLRTTKTLQATKAYTDAELPTVSVLIPARNETDDLHACLDALVASNYPKLEIIVLDDCSQNKHTPEIIRSYAQSGVRFIAGEAPNDNWLAKNFAYQQLADTASGEYLLFCGVDLLLAPDAIHELITTMLEKKKTMMSVLPQNVSPHNFMTYLIQPMRYAWELSLPRRLFNRPPVLSTCWIIKHDVLDSAGSFKAASRSILPESHFARFTARNDGYSFLRSNMLISAKPVYEQRATTVRMRYPQLHRRPELVWAVTLTELLCLVLPLPVAILAAVHGAWIAVVLAVAAHLLGYVVLLEVTGVMYGQALIWGFVMVPIATLHDIYLLNYSFYRYEFSQVYWKERNICLPIMRFDNPPTRQS